MDVLSRMLVTAAVFQLEMSALNARAPWNAVGGCRCRGGHNPKIIKIEKTSKKKKQRGVSGQNSSERTNNRNKRVEWTYLSANWSLGTRPNHQSHHRGSPSHRSTPQMLDMTRQVFHPNILQCNHHLPMRVYNYQPQSSKQHCPPGKT